MKKPKKKTKVKRRLPLEAVRRLRSYSVTTKKGEKGYSRKKLKERNRKIDGEGSAEENN